MLDIFRFLIEKNSKILVKRLMDQTKHVVLVLYLLMLFCLAIIVNSQEKIGGFKYDKIHFYERFVEVVKKILRCWSEAIERCGKKPEKSCTAPLKGIFGKKTKRGFP